MDHFINLPKMFDKKRAQISMEYLIVIGFITFIIISLMGVAFYYVGGIKDSIKENQLEGFGQKIISSAETVYYAGSPSKLTVQAYLPAGVSSITVSNTHDLIITYSTNTGVNTRSFESKVPLVMPTNLPTTEGVQSVVISAIAATASQSAYAQICSINGC